VVERQSLLDSNIHSEAQLQSLTGAVMPAEWQSKGAADMGIIVRIDFFSLRKKKSTANMASDLLKTFYVQRMTAFLYLLSFSGS
jgi:hypothetical protein